MKFTSICAVATTIALATSAAIKRDEPAADECAVVWVTVTEQPQGASSTQSKTTTTTSASSVPDVNTKIQATASASASSSSPSASAAPRPGSNDNATSAIDLNEVRLPGGQAPIPINEDYTHAPEDNTPIPEDVVIFSPSEPGVFDSLAFAKWRDQQRDNPPPSKFLKVKPGAYRMKLGPKLNPGDDPNNTEGENLIMYLMKGGWTLDLRGVTLYVDFTPENRLQRPNVVIYTLQSDNLTILGGTIWTDWGEIYTQARVTSIQGETATFQVEQGYNVSKWLEAGPRNQGCIDTSDPNHFVFPGCNFWKVEMYNFDKLNSDRTFTAHLLGGSNLEVGHTVFMMNGQNEYNTVFTLANEANTGLHVKGMTTNGGFMSIGVDNGETPPVFTDCYSVNPPPRPGFAARAMGPLIGWANVNAGAIYDQPDRPKSTFQNSFYQYTGSPKDLWDTSRLDASPR